MREYHTNWVYEDATPRFTVSTTYRPKTVGTTGGWISMKYLVVISHWTQRLPFHGSPFIITMSLGQVTTP